MDWNARTQIIWAPFNGARHTWAARLNRPVQLAGTGLVAMLCLVSAGCGVLSTGQNVQGKRFFEQGQYTQAIESFQQALRNNPRSADAWYNLGATYAHLGKQQQNAIWLQQADQFYRQALVVDPNHADTRRSLAALMIEGNRAQEAFQMVEGWRATAPGNADPVIELARMHREAGNREQSMQLLIEALNIDPNNAVALRAMGVMREEAGDTQMALQNYIRSYQANNLQADLAQRIAALQGTMRTASQPMPFQPGQSQLGGVNQYVPR